MKQRETRLVRTRHPRIVVVLDALPSVTIAVAILLVLPASAFLDISEPGWYLFWLSVVVWSLCVLETCTAALVQVLFEGRLRYRENLEVVGWGEEGFQQATYMPDEGVLVGKVFAHEPVIQGPDGRPCVAALRVLEKLREENRWSAFVVETPMQRVVVSVDQERLVGIVAGSWTIEAARPRWFGWGAFAPLAATGERLDWVIVRPGDTVRIVASFVGEQPVSNERPDVSNERLEVPNEQPEVSNDGVGEPVTPTDSPYRPRASEFHVRLRRRDGGPVDGGSLPILLDVVNSSTDEWSRRARVHDNLTRIGGLLGGNMLIVGVAGSEVLFSAIPRIVVLLGGAVLLIVRSGVWVANARRWARPSGPVVGETQERGDQSSSP